MQADSNKLILVETDEPSRNETIKYLLCAEDSKNVICQSFLDYFGLSNYTIEDLVSRLAPSLSPDMLFTSLMDMKKIPVGKYERIMQTNYGKGADVVFGELRKLIQ